MKKNFRIIIAITVLICSINSVSSQDFVSEDMAKKVGYNFISQNSNKSQARLKLVNVQNGRDNQPNMYIFDVEDGGFVIVSASKKVRPILAYSFENSFGDEIPRTTFYFINNYNNLINFHKESEAVTDGTVVEFWEALENNVLKTRTTTIVDPLLDTRWNQDCYYNEYAPFDANGPCDRAYAGCVACSMSQIMKYWNYPEKGKGSHSYNHHKYGTLSADFGSTTYDWENMPNEIWSENDAIATLMYQCGVSVDMNYGYDGSGAQSNDVETAMRMYFGYSSAMYKERSSYQDDAWIALLKSELDESRPMYFSGTSDIGSHAIVCDGYDNNDYFHFNMGWSGMSDGFYSIDDVNGFNRNEAIVMNIRPLSINSDENGIIYVASDGTGDGSSWENATPYLEYAASIGSDGETQIWVKEGTYYGDANGENGAFYIYQKNRVYGGLVGNEPADYNLDNRDLENNVTILDGENTHRVLYQYDHFGNTAYSIWDGFTIQNGHAGSGGALYICSNSYFYNCNFINNTADGSGGAVYSVTAMDNSSKNIFENCRFENNAASMGGAIFDMTGLNLLNNKFFNNTAYTKGGAYYVFMNKNSEVSNCIFADNTANNAGAIYNRGSMLMTNCNIINNHAQENAGGLYNEVKYSKFYNSIFWNNHIGDESHQIEGESTLINCAVEGGFNGLNIINLSSENNGNDNLKYPKFMDPETYNYELLLDSPLINAGENNVTFLPKNDINYGWRIGQGRVDIGAYEYQGGVDLTEIDNEDYHTIYPNPVHNMLNIVGKDNMKINIYNSLGQKIHSVEGENNVNIDASNWKAGLYIININEHYYKILK